MGKVIKMPTQAERLGIVETKVENLDSKLDDIKSDVKEMHDCLDKTRDLLADKLEKMQEEYRSNSGKFFEHAEKLHAEDVTSHTKMSNRISELEQLKNKWIYMILGGAAVLGWVTGHIDKVASFLK
jgi:predicted RNase H-like nuclease (RuvC/YqgF family)